MDEVKHLNVRDEINVYPRKVWTWQNGKKIVSRALVLEVPKDYKDVINREIMNMDKSMYPKLEYVPFARYEDEEYKNILAKVLRSNNQYLHETRRITIYGITNIQDEYELLNGAKVTFQEWVEQLTYQNVEFVEACELGKNQSIKIVYHKKFERTIRRFMGNGIKSLAIESFRPEDIGKIFCSRDRSNTGDSGVTDEEMKYFDELKRRYGQNPQESDQCDKRELEYSKIVQGPPKKLIKKNLYYSHFEEPNIMKFNDNDINVTQTNIDGIGNSEKIMSQEVVSKLEKMSERILLLESNRNEPIERRNDGKEKTTIEQSIRIVEQSFDEKLRQMSQSFTKKMEESNSRHNKMLKNSEDRLLQKIGEMQLEQVDKIQTSTLEHMDKRLEFMFQKICERISQPGSTDNEGNDTLIVGKN